MCVLRPVLYRNSMRWQCLTEMCVADHLGAFSPTLSTFQLMFASALRRVKGCNVSAENKHRIVDEVKA